MIKNIILAIFFLLISNTIYSQGEANNWFFGYGAGLVFDNVNNTVTPTAAAQNTIDTFEGCSSISDPNGNLKFYTDGRDVWDANHNLMPNANYYTGSGLLGDPSSTSSAVIIPKPGDLDKYYVFTVDEPHHQNAWAFPNQGPADFNGFSTTQYNDSFTSVPVGDDGFNNGLNYSLVDMTLNNGMGDIDIVEKNIQLLTYDQNNTEQIKYKCGEKISAVEHADGQSYWVLTHFISAFYAFRVDSDGVNLSPSISNVTPSIGIEGYRRNAIGYLKSSPNGEKIAIAHNQNGSQEGEFTNNGSAWIYDFNRETGQVTGAMEVLSNDRFYGVAFSQNSEKVYFSSNTGVQQIDLTATDVPNTAEFIYVNVFGGGMGAMQLGPNGKIYVASQNNPNALDVINDPNETGAASNYVEGGQQLSPGTQAGYGLPPFIQSFLVANISYVNDCSGSNTQFSLSTSETIVSLEWDFGDSETSTELNPSHIYNTPGQYTVSVTITTTTESQTFETLVTIFESPTANPVADISICDDNNDGVSSFDFNTDVTPDVLDAQGADFAVSYHPTLLDAQDNTNAYPNPYTNTLTQETVFVRIENVNNTSCFDTTSFGIEVFDTPVIAAFNDLQNCDDGADGELTNGQTDTDLSALSPVVMGTQDAALFSVSYHLSAADAAAGDNGLPLTYYNTTPFNQALFVRIENSTNTDCFVTQEFNVIVNTTPTANPVADISICDDNNDGVSSFDFNTDVTPDVLDAQGADFAVSYHPTLLDAQDNTNAYPNPYTNTLTQETVFVRIENVNNTSCFDTTSFGIEVFDTPVIAAFNDLQNCDDGADGELTNGQTDTDLSALSPVVMGTQDAALFSVSYHLSAADAAAGDNGLPLTYYNTTPFNQALFVRIENSTNTDCFVTQEFNVIVNTTPTANPVADISICDDNNDGVSSFDFNTDVTPDVLDAQGADFAVSYHPTLLDAQDNTNAYPNPYTNTLTQETVFVRIENVNNTSCFDTTSFGIEVFDTPVIAAFNDLQNCDDGADGELTNGQTDTDLSALSPVVMGTQDAALFSVSYHLSAADAAAGDNGLPLTYYNTTPFNQALFVRIENSTNTDCFVTQEFNVIVNTTPTANPVADISICDDNNDGVSSFDFNTDVTPDVLDAQGADFAVSYHPTLLDAQDNTNAYPNPYTNTLTQETVFVRIENVNNTSCFDTTSFGIEVFDTPVIAAFNDLQNCDDGADGELTNGQTDTDLSALSPVVMGTQDAALFSVSYHLSAADAAAGDNGLPLTYYNTTPFNQALFVRIENSTNTDCFVTQEFNVIVNTTPTANPVADISICDDNNDGVSSFDFNTDVTPDVLDAQGADFAVSYHPTLLDAQDNTNAYPNPYTNTLTQETVFVRIENVNNTSCFDTTSFGIEVFDTPVIAAFNDLQNCDDGADGELTNGQTDTDLSALSPVVMGTQDAALFSVSYHLSAADAAAGDNGLPLTYYNTTPFNQALFVRIENSTNTDCFVTQEFNVIVNTTPTANPVADISICDDNNDGVSSFDFNTDVTPDVLDAQGADFAVSYHPTLLDAQDNTNAYPNPYTNTLTQETVFVRIENVNNTSCFDTTSFGIEVFDTPVLPLDFEYYQCDYTNSGDLVETFDLTSLNGSIANGQDVTITHYENEIDAENETNPIVGLYTNTSTTQMLYVLMVSNISTECRSIGSYTIGVDPLPNVVVDVPLVQCDIDDIQDGISIYNLEEAAENLVVGDDPTNYVLTFHLFQADLDAGTNAISDPTSYVNQTPLQTIFVRVENIATTCYTSSFFYLETIFNPIPEDAGLIVCDNSEMNGNDYDGLGLFTLSNANDYILSLIVANPNNDITDPNQLTIAYYKSEIDALLELNQLPDQYTSEVPDDQTLFIRVERGNDCFGINSIQLQVLPVPDYNEVPDEILCTYTPGSITIDLSDYDPTVLGTQDADEVIITYHTTQEDSDTGANALISPYTIFDEITLFVREEIQNNDPLVTACFISNVNFTLTVEPRPVFGVPIPLIVCDDDGVLDGLTTLDISVQTELIRAGIADNVVSYHFSQEDADSGDNPLDALYTTVIPDLQTIFVRIENDLTAITGCYSTTPFDLVVVSPPNATTPIDFEFCDEDADGFGIFDLTELDAEITGTLSNLIISYHETEAEALNNVNAIVGDYSNIVAYRQTIFVRIEDTTITTACYTYLNFQLIINDVPQIELNPEPLEVCDDDTDGIALFDLSLANDQILNGLNPLDFEVTYYETFANAELKSNPFNTPLTYTNTSPTAQTIFVRVENIATECFKSIALPIIVNPLPVMVQATPLELCDDAVADQQTTFDLTEKNLEITDGDGSLEVVYYTTLLDAEDATNAIADPTAYTNTAIGTAAANPQTVHIRVTDLDTGCYDLTTLTIRVLPNPTPNLNPDNLIACDDTNSGDGLEVFDLKTYETLIINGELNVSPTYHETLDDALNGINAIPNSTNYTNTETPVQTIYVRVTNDLTNCYTVVDFDLIVNPIPNAIVVDDLIACELNTDDVFDFDLETQSSLILGGQDPTLFKVTYHTSLADAALGINFLGSPYTNSSDPQTIYVSVENSVTECRNTTVQFNLAVHEAALASSPVEAYVLCDDNVETDGNSTNDRVQFDLSTQDVFVLNGQDPTNYTVRYYANQSDADLDINALPTLFENSVNPQSIIARVDNDTLIADSSGALVDSSICFETATVTLEVNPLPVVEIEEEYILCVDLNGSEVLAPLVIDTGLSDVDYTFVWRDASGTIVGTNSSYAPVQGGDYTLEVFDDTLITECAAPIVAFTVIESTPPEVTAQVTTAAFANTHVIETVATGQGQFEYSLDQGPWGDSGTFIDVTPGEHMVTVRDINGCGEANAFVYVIDYPLYFTPNGDGYHDTWNIMSVSNQVDAKIYIFDRLGKLIKEIYPSGTGWDGTYNGALLPSSDYWFTLNYIDPTTANPKELRAHFSLKR